MTAGRSLELYLVDGKPDGMLTAEVFNWTGHVLRIPRTQVAHMLRQGEATDDFGPGSTSGVSKDWKLSDGRRTADWEAAQIEGSPP